jgi:hypothetical protein
MGSQLLGEVLACAPAIGVSGNLAAQERPAAAKPAVAASFDPHDLSGAWMQDRPRPGRMIERYLVARPDSHLDPEQMVESSRTFGLQPNARPNPR